MAKMGRYCKAYPVDSLRQFSGWTIDTENLRKDGNGDGDAAASKNFFYLQENFTVTDGVFIDENIVFQNVTPEWIDFCRDTLKFEVPDYAATTQEAKN